MAIAVYCSQVAAGCKIAAAAFDYQLDIGILMSLARRRRVRSAARRRPASAISAARYGHGAALVSSLRADGRDIIIILAESRGRLALPKAGKVLSAPGSAAAYIRLKPGAPRAAFSTLRSLICRALLAAPPSDFSADASCLLSMPIHMT